MDDSHHAADERPTSERASTATLADADADTATLAVSVFNPSTGWRLPEEYVERIRGVSDRVEVRDIPDRDQLLETLPEIDYLVGFPVTDEEFSKRGGRLKWIQLTTASADMVLSMPSVMSSSVRITTAEGFQAKQRAEHAIMLMLALLRRLPRAFSAQLDHEWIAHELSSVVDDLSGKTVGVIGLGSIGHAIIERLRPFDCEILGGLGDPADSIEGVGAIFPRTGLDELLSRSDIIVIATPLSPSVDGMLDRGLLGNLKRSALLVNVSRAQAWDETAVIDSISRGRIAGLGLDVFSQSPLPETSPLWRMSNAIITPRLGGVSPQYWRRATECICTNLQRLEANEPLHDEVQRDQ
ncbi:MAG: NAD(P)-dependent oxidoreductase [Phycisphaerales bacterium]